MFVDSKTKLIDANSATKIKPDWAKGFFRKGKAYACLKRYRECVEAYEQALSLDPDSKMLQKNQELSKVQFLWEMKTVM